MKNIRASELSTYHYCARAWWYARQGIESSNRSELAAGAELHRLHGRAVLASGLIRTLAVLLLLAALMVLVATCTSSLF